VAVIYGALFSPVYVDARTTGLIVTILPKTTVQPIFQAAAIQ
jgi:hypothetical protein